MDFFLNERPRDKVAKERPILFYFWWGVGFGNFSELEFFFRLVLVEEFSCL